jgi:cytochrome c-type biogenesis protein CcmH
MLLTLRLAVKKSIMQRLILFILMSFSSGGFALTQELYPFDSPQQATRFQTLTQEIRCVVCQSQSIADSSAPLAVDMRQKIYHLILAKQSDAEIQAYLLKRYGDFILLKPRFVRSTWFLWLFPLVGLMIVIAYLYRANRKAHLIKF